MRKFLIALIWVFVVQVFAFSSSTEVVFFQQSKTTKKKGTEANPAVIGGVRVAPGRALTKEQQRAQFEEAVRKLRSQQSKPAADQQAPKPSAQQASGATATPRQEGQPAVTSQPAAPASMGLEFNNAPIQDVVRAVMKELGYPYYIDPQVSGTVTLYTMRSVPRSELFGILEQILKMNGQAIIHQEGLYVIAPIGESPRIPHKVLLRPQEPEKETTPPKTGEKGKSTSPAEKPPAKPGDKTAEPSSSEKPPVQNANASSQQQQTSGQASQAGGAPVQSGSSQGGGSRLEAGQKPDDARLSEEKGVITYIIPLNYVPSSQMVQMAQAFVSNGAHVIDFAPTNMIMITDFKRNIEQVLHLVELLDTQYFDLNTVDLIPVRFNQAKDVADDLGKIFAPDEKTAGVRIVAIDRLNSLLVVTRTPAAFQEVKHWISKLDAPSSGNTKKTYVYEVENNTAANIADVLSQLYQDGSGLPSGTSGEDQAKEQPTRPTREPGFVRPEDRRFLQPQQLGPSLQGRPLSNQSQIRSVVAGNVKIIVNEFNNSLIIQATPSDYQFLLDTIKQLDVLPRQVLIEAKVYSVELRDDLSFGINSFLQKRGAGIPQPSSGSGDTGTELQPGAATTGSVQSGNLQVITKAVFGDRQLQAVLNALRTRTNVRALQVPSVLAMDGMEASINVGAQVPVTTASFGDPLLSGSTSFINNINFRPTGTTLLFLPRISASGIVTLDLSLEISSATSGPALTPTINTNSVSTSLIVRDGQTVAIAGIITDELNNTRNRVPVLGDIPILGALFGKIERNKRRFELIFLITPRVIHNLPTAAELTLRFKRALRESYDYIQKQETEEKALIERRKKEELEKQQQQQKPPQDQ